MRKIAAFVSCLLASAAVPAFAQEEDDYFILYDGPRAEITVLASGQPTRLDTTGQPITLFTAEDIDALQGVDFVRLAERIPGVTVSRNGGAGSFTALRVRGAEADQLLVLVDGVRLADPAAPKSGFDIGTLALGSLARVELLRGANSTIWGSQALGGVLAVESRLPQGAELAAEYGAYDSFYGSAAAGVEAGPVSLALGGGYQTSDGFSAAAGGTEADGHRQFDLSARASAQVSEHLSAFAVARFADARLDTDGYPYPPGTLADTEEYQDTRQVSGQAGLAWGSDQFDLKASFSQADTERQNYDPAYGTAPGYTADGTSRMADLRGRFQPLDDVQLRFGAEREWTTFATLFDTRRSTVTSAAYAQADYNSGPLHLALGLRRDEHRGFGGAWSLGADGSYALAEGLRLRASYGEGFRAPSLFELLSDYGNAALRPERARSYDAGLNWQAGSLSLALTGFRRDTHDQIVYDGCYLVTTGICAGRPNGTYDNRARTRAQGIEVEAAVAVTDGLNLSAVYSLIDTEDRTPASANRGNALIRRPRHAATLSADWSPVQNVSLAADLRLVSHSFDNAANTAVIGSYAAATVRGSWDISDKVQLFARVENLGDEDYQTAAGYAQAGRSAYAGVRLKL